jgi:hypothetical protein
MRDVYRNAATVPIWLGDASSLTDNATGKPLSTIFLEYVAPMVDEMKHYERIGKEMTSSPLYCKLRSELSTSASVRLKVKSRTSRRPPCRKRHWKRFLDDREDCKQPILGIIYSVSTESSTTSKIYYRIRTITFR